MSEESLPPGWAQIEIEDSLLPYPNGKMIRQGWSPQCEDHPAQSHDEWAVLRTSAIQDGSFVDGENKKLPESLKPRPHLEVQAGDILITCAGPRSRCGVTCLVRATRPRLLISGKMYQLRANPEVIERHFLELFLRESGTRKKIDGMKTGISDSGLNLTHDRFRTLSIPLPPLAEQKRIVAKIEELFSELEAGEESLRVARRQLGVYRQSLLKQAFEGKLTAQWRTQNPAKLESQKSLLAKDGREKPQIETLPPSWEPCYMKDFVSIERGRFSVRPRGDPRYYGGGTPFVQIGDLPREGGTITGYKQTLNEAGLGVSKLFCKGTPLIAIVGATIGNTGILGFDSCCPDSVVALVSPEPITGKFVELYFRAHKDRIRSDSYSSGGQPNINNAYLERQPIGVPSLPEQQEIVRLLDEQFEVIERNERELDAALKRSEALRQAILKKAFTGRLVPQSPADEPASQLLTRLRTERETSASGGRKAFPKK